MDIRPTKTGFRRVLSFGTKLHCNKMEKHENQFFGHKALLFQCDDIIPVYYIMQNKQNLIKVSQEIGKNPLF